MTRFFHFQSGVRRNGRVVQGFSPITEAQEETEADGKEDDEATSVSLSSDRNRAVNLRDAGGTSPLGRPGQRTTGQMTSQRKIQEMTLTTLDPSNLSTRWV